VIELYPVQQINQVQNKQFVYYKKA